MQIHAEALAGESRPCAPEDGARCAGKQKLHKHRTYQRSAFALILVGDEYLLGSLRLSVQRALFTRISATAVLAPLIREDIPASLNWQVSRAGLERDIFEPAAIDLLAEASQGDPRTLNLS